MIKVVSWNIDKQVKPWGELVRMAKDKKADLALLQEAGSPPGDLVHLLDYEDAVLWNRHLYDRWPLVVKLSDQIKVEPYVQVPPISELGKDDIGVSGIGTIAAAKVIPVDSTEEAFVAISMYGRWLKPHPSTNSKWIYADASAHRIISDLSAFIGHTDPSKHRILAAGDLNMFYGATGTKLSLPERERTVWNRHGGARAGIPGTAGSSRSESRNSAGRRAVRHEKRADVLQEIQERRWAGNSGESTGLRIRVARLPQEGVGACDERNP